MNHLSHFLLVNLLLEDLQKSPGGKPRCVIVGSGGASNDPIQTAMHDQAQTEQTTAKFCYNITQRAVAVMQ